MVFAQTMANVQVPQMSVRIGGAPLKPSTIAPFAAPIRQRVARRTAVVPQARGKLDPVRCHHNTVVYWTGNNIFHSASSPSPRKAEAVPELGVHIARVNFVRRSEIR